MCRLSKYAGQLGESDYKALATEAAGNHRKFDSFAWFARPEDDDLWTLVYTSNRDSGPLDKANAQVIAEALAPFVKRGTVRAESHSHWACGHVDGYAIKVYGSRGRITKAFKTWCDIKAALDDYPVLDESLWSEFEQKEIEESWDWWIRADFERAIEKAFDVELDASKEQLADLFYKACEASSEWPTHDGHDVCVDFDAIIEAVTIEQVRPLVPVQTVAIYRNGDLLCYGTLHLGEFVCGMALYAPEFEACMSADDNGADSVTIDGAIYTWSIA